MPLAPGSRFDRYEIETLLGEGGMGRVYLAFDPRLQRRVALKVLSEPGGANDGARSDGVARMLREARAAAAFDHPNVVAIHDIGEQDGVPYIAMELVLGKSLRAYAIEGSVSVADRVRWLADVANALHAAHRAGLVHRDVKPENVMVRDDGVVKVLDFGIARRVRFALDPTAPTGAVADPLATITKDGVLVGTPAYMAPEQIRGHELDGAADQFSWGVMAYELLAGRLPWDSLDGVAMVAAIVAEEPRPLSELRPETTGTLSDTVMRALSKPRADRFATMADVARSLTAGAASLRGPAADSVAPAEVGRASLQSHTSTRSVAVRDAEQGARSVHRRRAGVVIALATIVVVAVGGGVLAQRRSRASNPPRPPSSSQPQPSAAATGIAITDLPDPRGCSDAALAEYRSALLVLRGRGWRDAQARLENAVKADPQCAAAHVRLALVGSTDPRYRNAARDREAARDEYQKALLLREALDDRDRDLLDLLEPLLGRESSNRTEHTARSLAFAKKRPNDAEASLLAARSGPGFFESRYEQAKRGVVLDPRSADAWESLSSFRLSVGDIDGARTAIEECVRVAPASSDCQGRRIEYQSGAGECAGMEVNARTWRASAPLDDGSWFLANALAAQGKDRDSVLEALAQRWQRAPVGLRTVDEWGDRAQLAVLRGDFVTVNAAAIEIGRGIVAGDARLGPHVRHAQLLAKTALETGRDTDAAKVAADFLGRRSAWASASLDGPGEVEGEPFMLHVEHLVGTLAPAAWKKDIEAWSARMERDGSAGAPARWVLAHALDATNGEAAKVALESIPASGLLDGKILRGGFASGFSQSLMLGLVGRTFALAGRSDEALAFLRAATVQCMVLADAFGHTWAHLWLGHALEKKGDPAGACAAYNVVLARWGKATPTSVTAAAARARTTALHCGS